MEHKNPILRNEKGPTTWNVVLDSPHGVAYRLWTRKSGEDWIVVGEGILSDEIVDSGSFDTVKGMEFAYWVGIGSNRPNSLYKLSIVLSQEGTILPNGILKIDGRLNDQVADERSSIVVLS